MKYIQYATHNPNLKGWDYSDIPGGGTQKDWKVHAHGSHVWCQNITWVSDYLLLNEPLEKKILKFLSKYFHSRKYIWKYHPQSVNHFAQCYLAAWSIVDHIADDGC